MLIVDHNIITGNYAHRSTCAIALIIMTSVDIKTILPTRMSPKLILFYTENYIMKDFIFILISE